MVPRGDKAMCLTACLWLLSVGTVTMVTPSIPEQGAQHADYCVPEVWQGGRSSTLGVVSKSGENTVKRTFGNVIYSAKQQKMMVDENSYAREGQYVRMIFDYPGHVLYTIKGSLNQTCKKTPLLGPFAPQCVPGNSTVSLKNSTFGTGKNTVVAMELSGIQKGVHYRVSLTYDTYVPLYEQLWGNKNGENFFQFLSFYNVTISSELPASIFKPPSVCDHAPLQSIQGRSADDIVHVL